MVKPDHEYSVVGGYRRLKISRWIGGISVLVSSVLLLIDLAKHFGFNDIIQPLILWSIGTGTIYVALYWFFVIRFWRNKYINAALKVPDVEGTWQIEGHKLREDGRIELE